MNQTVSKKRHYMLANYDNYKEIVIETSENKLPNAPSWETMRRIMGLSVPPPLSDGEISQSAD